MKSLGCILLIIFCVGLVTCIGANISSRRKFKEEERKYLVFLERHEQNAELMKMKMPYLGPMGLDENADTKILPYKISLEYAYKEAISKYGPSDLKDNLTAFSFNEIVGLFEKYAKDKLIEERKIEGDKRHYLNVDHFTWDELIRIESREIGRGKLWYVEVNVYWKLGDEKKLTVKSNRDYGDHQDEIIECIPEDELDQWVSYFKDNVDMAKIRGKERERLIAKERQEKEDQVKRIREKYINSNK